MSLVSVGASALPILGGLFGRLFGSSDRKEAENLLKQILDDYNRIQAPSIANQMLDLEGYRSVGRYTPEMEAVYTQGPSAFENIEIDPRLRDAELDALAELRGIGSGGGLRLSDKLGLSQAIGAVNRNARAKREAILSDMQARGRGGSGFELAALLAGNQADAERASNEGLNIAAMAEDRALRALLEGGDLAGRIRDRDFSQAAQKAQAADIIGRFNTQNRQDVAARNTNRINEGSLYNLREGQRIADSNVDLRNRQQIHNKGLYQTDFDNRLRLTGAQAQARKGLADFKLGRAQDTQQMFAGIGAGAGQMLSGLRADDPRKKLYPTIG